MHNLQAARLREHLINPHRCVVVRPCSSHTQTQPVGLAYYLFSCFLHFASFFIGWLKRDACRVNLPVPDRWGNSGKTASAQITKASVLAEFFFALAMLSWEGLRALKIDISS